MKNPAHPGGFLKSEIIEALGLSVTDAPQAFGVSMPTLMRMQNSFDIASNADSSNTVKTLTELAITSINQTADTTRIELPDGSVIEGQTTFTRSNGTTGTVATTAPMAEAEGHQVISVAATDGAGTRTVTACDSKHADLAHDQNVRQKSDFCLTLSLRSNQVW